ncbi:Gfo/Idh/MocA family protein [Amycolatopsis palatopharyngis]|uniref:Gfo/Idh/MocA family protein n=1 Tax=Amycolatopsis palatopharyngis TaxID=187982 RepID=UPI0013BE941C|nr:Gfo/Idh/MocA family oxidoreductase [Amycolatopsis palatopharyngis]
MRLGIIGVGDFGTRHAAIAAALPEIELVAVADRDERRRRLVAERLGVAACLDAQNLLEQHSLDGVVIATPLSQHMRDISTALSAGVHLLVEKPVVAAGAEIDQLECLPRAQRMRIVPAHVSRFLPAVAVLRERLANQRVRTVRAIRVVPAERLDLHGADHPAMVAMVHDLDLVRAFVGETLGHVSSVQRWTDDTRPHPQIVMAHLGFDDGVIASVENHWTLPHARQYIDSRIEIVTERETAHLTLPSNAVRIVTARGDYLPDTELEGSVAGLPVGALATQLRHFAQCVITGRDPSVVTLDDALWSVRVAAEIASQSPQP